MHQLTKNHLDNSINNGINGSISSIAKIIKEMKSNPKGIRFNELQKVCEHYFGEP